MIRAPLLLLTTLTSIFLGLYALPTYAFYPNSVELARHYWLHVFGFDMAQIDIWTVNPHDPANFPSVQYPYTDADPNYVGPPRYLPFGNPPRN